MTQMPINKRSRHKSPRSGETGFTFIELIIVLVIASILGIFTFQTITKCLASQINMQNRKERSDDAISSMERMNREIREAKTIFYANTDILYFKKNVPSGTDTNTLVLYVRNPTTRKVMRQSAVTQGDLPGNNTSGDVIASEVSLFYAVDNNLTGVTIKLKFTDGSSWQTNSFPRNYGLGL